MRLALILLLAGSGDLRKYSLHISAIKAMIEIAGLEEYREAA